MSDRILVMVKHLDDVAPARALLRALPELNFVLWFAAEDLRTRGAEPGRADSTDPFEYVLNSEQFGLVLCFSGARELSPNSNYLALSFFDEIGVPTVELQRDLLRDPLLAQSESAARHYLSWSGEQGTGALIEAITATNGAARDDVVLVTSHLANSPFSEEQRYQFAFAVMRLAREYPQLSFLWRASPAEEQNAEAKLLLAMLGGSGPENLWLEENEPLEGLLARASAVITMAQTSLLTFAAAQKPVLAYVNAELRPRLSEVSLKSFQSPAELLASFSLLRAEPQAFLVQSRVPALALAALRMHLTRIAATRAATISAAERRAVALRYVSYMQEQRMRADLARVGPQISALDKRLGELEKLWSNPRDRPAMANAKTAQKNGSPLSVARKALKLARDMKKRAFRP